jgi:hypothetical protein
MERMLPEVLQVLSCVNNAMLSVGQKEEVKSPCFV